MYRCLLISAMFHGALLLFVAILSLTEPPVEKRKPLIINIKNPPGGGGGAKKESKPAGQMASLPDPAKLKTALQKQMEEALKRAAEKKVEEKKPKPKEPETKKEIIKPTVEKKADTPSKKVVTKDKEKKKIVESAPTPKGTPKPKEKVVASAEIDTADLLKESPKKTPAPSKSADIDLDDLGSLLANPALNKNTLGKIAAGTGAGPGAGGPGRGFGSGAGVMSLSESYAYMALFQIQQQFKPPYMKSGVQCVVSFHILQDGTIDQQSVKIISSTGRTELDQAALRALTDTAKLPPLYDGFNKQFLEAEIVFEYEKQA